MGSVLLAAVIGLAVGVVVGALGAGGGILAVPVLVLLLGQDPHAATASSLVIVLLTALASLVHRARTREVAWRQGLVFALCTTVGGVAGSRASVLVDGTVLLAAFALLLGAVAVAMARQGLAARRSEQEEAETEDGGPAEDLSEDLSAEATDPARPRGRTPSLPALVLAATVTGLLTGFFGVGGGFVVVPILVLALGMGPRRAAGTSLLVMIVASLVGLASRADILGALDWTVTLVFAVGSMAGGLLGGPLSARARVSTLTLAFAVLLGVVACATAGSLIL
ncbi:sulfite exporter TauE/SafE family protein [Brachybacterium nesterenkovii]|uniref:sulfite exporter TauE/SafE family protein n=1 Tax=Brachybacterium nesterenkovii TaxID=47847 RepID=UPI003218E879